MAESINSTRNAPSNQADNTPSTSKHRGWRYWIDLIILVNLARLRFIFILLLIGLVLIYWDTLVGYYRKWTRPAPVSAHLEGEYEWFCPMHPNIVRDNPNEKCPICHMPLSRRKKTLQLPEPLPPGVVSRIQLSPYRVILAGIRTCRIDYVRLHRNITTVGYVEFDERGLRQIAARVKGRLDKLYVSETGKMVHIGDDLALLYSPELIVTSQNLLDARRSGNAILYQTAQERLRLWGIDDDQISEIIRTGKPLTHLKIRSPMDGHVIRRYVREGQYIDEAMPLFDLADLSTVWIEGELYENDLVFLPPQEYFHHPEQAKLLRIPISATTNATGDERFSGFLTFIHPHLDANTRTVRVRYEVANPQHKLRPGTYATVTLSIPHLLVPSFQQYLAATQALTHAVALVLSHEASLFSIFTPHVLTLLPFDLGNSTTLQLGYFLAVPEMAVIDTGRNKVVYREIVPGQYEGILVQLGPRMEDENRIPYYPVLGGLQAGEIVVTAGSFLLDAETRLNPAAGSIYFGAAGTPRTSHEQVKPSTVADEEAIIRANLAKLFTKADRDLAAKQRYCPIQQKNRLGSMGPPVKIVLDGQPVLLCCSGCEEEARAHPQETLAVVKRLLEQHSSRSLGR